MNITQQSHDPMQQLREAWRNANIASPTEGTEARRTPRVAGKRRQLIRRLRLLALISVLMIGYVPLMLMHLTDTPLQLCVILALFFAVAATSFMLTSRVVVSADPARLSVADMLRALAAVERRLMLHRMVGWMFAIPIIAWMLWIFRTTSTAMFWGGVAGAVIGVIAGTVTYRRFRHIIADIRRELDGEDEEWKGKSESKK